MADLMSKQFEEGADYLQRKRLAATEQYRQALGGDDMRLILPTSKDSTKGNQLYIEKVFMEYFRMVESTTPERSPDCSCCLQT